MTSTAPGFMDASVRSDPYPFYEAMRREAPIHRIPELGMWMVTRYDLIMQVLRDVRTYSNEIPRLSRPDVAGEAADRLVETEGFGRGLRSIQNNDPPAHTIFRKLVNDAFRLERITQMEAYIREVAGDLIGALAGAAVCDAVAQFAVPLPLYVIADQLGIPRADYLRFKSWSDAWLASTMGVGLTPEALMQAAERVVEMQHYLVARIGERRRDPRGDILSDLAHATYGDERPLTDKEIPAVVEQLLVAGNESTTAGIAAGLLVLAQDPGLSGSLRASPEAIKAFVEEILRLESPVQGLFRRVTRPVRLGDVDLASGDVLMVQYAAGNRDPAKFERPDDVDLQRPNLAAHMAFGFGLHHCVGFQLARAEMTTAFSLFLSAFDPFELAVEPETLRYGASIGIRSLRSLPLRLSPAA